MQHESMESVLTSTSPYDTKLPEKKDLKDLAGPVKAGPKRKAAALLAELKANITVGTGPRALEEKRLLEENRRKEIERQEQIDQAADRRFRQVFEQYCQVSTHKSSLSDEINYFKNWINPAIGNKRLDKITLLDLERLKKKMVTAGKALQTIVHIKKIIRQVYHFAIDHNLYSGEVPTLKFLKKQKLDNRRQRFLSPEEADAFVGRTPKAIDRYVPYKSAVTQQRYAIRGDC